MYKRQVWSWEQNDLKIVHMGGAAGDIDINSQIILSRPDILFISIGGGIKSYDGQEASRIVKLLKPNVVIPVHYARGKKINIMISQIKNFLFLILVSSFLPTSSVSYTHLTLPTKRIV